MAHQTDFEGQINEAKSQACPMRGRRGSNLKMFLSKCRRKKRLGFWMPISLILWIIASSLSLPQVLAEETNSTDVGNSTNATGRAEAAEPPEDDTPSLTAHFKALHKTYKDKSTLIYDCKFTEDAKHKDDPQHHHWGTKESVEFLAGERPAADMTLAETRMKLPKLRKYLTRVGFLKVPGSLVFMDKHMHTIKLTGCGHEKTGDGALWRMQGEKGEDAKFQDEGYNSKQLKQAAPSSSSYIHKFTCYRINEKERCSHTFYVITKMQPELPLDLMARENDPTGEYEFACTVPFCRLMDCTQPGQTEPIPRRSYPPFKISWHPVDTLAEELDFNKTALLAINLGTKDKLGTIPNVTYHGIGLKKMKEETVKIVWAAAIRAHKDTPLNNQEDSYFNTSFNYDYKDGFGEKKNHSDEEKLFELQSRLSFPKTHEDIHHGEYECIIEDANGIVTTPNVMAHEYRGKASVFVIPTWLLYGTFGAVVVSAILVAIIVLLCPKKMEYDDGRTYTKDELVAPDKMAPAPMISSVGAKPSTTSKGGDKAKTS